MAAPELLLRLLDAPGPSGLEDAPSAIWRDAAGDFASVTSDTLGSSVARLDGEGPLLALVGHIDEIGLVLTHIGDDGLIAFRRIGGYRPEVLVGQRIEILTHEGRVPGLVARERYEPPKKEVEAAKVEELHVDIGARDGEAARRLVRPGDTAVLAASPAVIGDERLVGRSLDNRLGAYVALEALRRLAEEERSVSVAAVASVQEETDYGGARSVVHSLEPDLVLVFDVTTATDYPGSDVKDDGAHPLGSGPAILRSPSAHPRLSELLCDAAEAEGIPYTVEASGGNSATDADVIHYARGGIPTALASIPLRYMHSPVELADLGDVESTIRLAVAFARRLTADLDLTR